MLYPNRIEWGDNLHVRRKEPEGGWWGMGGGEVGGRGVGSITLVADLSGRTEACSMSS